MLPIKDSESSGIFPVLTISIIVACAYVLFREYIAINTDAFIYKWSMVPAKLDFNNIATLITLVTSIFLHGGLLHFLSNMLYLWIFGDNVEAALGKIGFILFYISGGIVANLAQLYFLKGQDVPVLGASGAIAAILGYYLIRFSGHSIKTLVPIFGFFTFMDLPATIVLGMWFVIQLFSGVSELAQTTAGSGVAFWAHIGGFVYGVLVGLLIKGRSNKQYYTPYRSY